MFYLLFEYVKYVLKSSGIESTFLWNMHKNESVKCHGVDDLQVQSKRICVCVLCV